MATEEKFLKLLLISSYNGWKDYIGLYRDDDFVIKDNNLFVGDFSCGMGKTHSIDELVCIKQDGVVSFIEALYNFSIEKNIKLNVTAYTKEGVLLSDIQSIINDYISEYSEKRLDILFNKFKPILDLDYSIIYQDIINTLSDVEKNIFVNRFFEEDMFHLYARETYSKIPINERISVITNFVTIRCKHILFRSVYNKIRSYSFHYSTQILVPFRMLNIQVDGKILCTVEKYEDSDEDPMHDKVIVKPIDNKCNSSICYSSDLGGLIKKGLVNVVKK
jgi:hypothetical protein